MASLVHSSQLLSSVRALRRRLSAFGLCGALALSCALAPIACGNEATAAGVPVIVVTAQESGGYHYTLPSRVRAGLTRIVLDNRGGEAHHAQLLKLGPGKTVADLEAALASAGPPGALQVGGFAGGTALVSPGQRSRADALVDLSEGTYAVLCFVDAPDGKTHAAHGMIQPFTVHGPPRGPGSEPPARAKVSLLDYSFEAPTSISRKATLVVTNTSRREPHELIVARLDPGASAAEVVRAMEDHRRPPWTAVGGVQAILPGAAQQLKLTLEPGRYVFLCSVPSPDGVPHFAKGMVREVEIT